MICWLAADGTLVVLALVPTVATAVMTLRPAAGPTAGTAPSLPEAVGSSLMVLVYVPLIAPLPVLFVGVPAALGVVIVLRNVRNQGWHVVGFALAGSLTPIPALLFMGLAGNGGGLATLFLFGGAGALCAVVGRLAIWKLVEVAIPETPPA